MTPTPETPETVICKCPPNCACSHRTVCPHGKPISADRPAITTTGVTFCTCCGGSFNGRVSGSDRCKTCRADKVETAICKCGHPDDDHDAGECWAHVNGDQCSCAWYETPETAPAEILKLIRTAIADPGSFTPRQYEDRDGERIYETIPHWGARAVLAVIEDEAIDRMANKLAAIDRMANKLADETSIRSMDFRNGMAMELEPSRALVANWVGAARGMLGDAPNYSETPITMTVKVAEDPEEFVFILQRVGPGKLTPHQARLAAEKERDELREQLDSERQARAAAEKELGRLRDQLASERDARQAAEATVTRVKTVKVWTNEDRKQFVFADDLRAAMDGETP